MEEKPNYYAVLPAKIRYDERLSNFSKLMFAEISALCNKEGYCWANNNYFSKLYGVSSLTITRSISQLVEMGYIQRELENINGTNTTRKLRMTISEMIIPPIKNDRVGDIKNDRQNTLNKINNKININICSKTDFDEFWNNLKGRKLNKPDAKKVYCKLKIDIPGIQLANRYNLLFKDREDKFIPYPAKWLRNEGWEDETSIEKVNGDIVYRNKDGYIISEEEYNKQK
tara:strand:- start:1019 stop:1702 length:684 start_codon:yes stop_codon:yes gene_type:complete